VLAGETGIFYSMLVFSPGTSKTKRGDREILESIKYNQIVYLQL